jgi:hypothetical protein
MSNAPQQKPAGSMRDEFPEIARWVDAMREQFGEEKGGQFTGRDSQVRAWGSMKQGAK